MAKGMTKRDAPADVARAVRRHGTTSTRRSFNVGTHGLRGVASVMVFAAHLLGGTAEHIYASNTAYVNAIRPFWNFGTFGVDLFFLISGFVILPSAMRYSSVAFAARRFWRLYPLFFAFSALFVVINLAANIEPKSNDLLSIVSGLLFINIWTKTLQLTPNAWSLTFEVWFYLMTALGVVVVLKHPSTIGRMAFLLLVGFFLSQFPIAFYFLGGVAVRLVFDRSDLLTRPRPLLEIAALVACVGLASLGHYDYRWSDLANPVVPSLIVVTSLYFALSVNERSLTSRLLSNRAIVYLGTISYSLYLVHPYTYVAVRSVFSHFGLFGPDVLSSQVAFFAATAFLTFPITHVVHCLLERAPYEAIFSERVYRSGKPGFFRRVAFGSSARTLDEQPMNSSVKIAGTPGGDGPRPEPDKVVTIARRSSASS